jgi:arginine deiminase
VDAIIEQTKANKRTQHILVQELPLEGESFIHLDMVFTFLSQYECMVYEPVIMQPNRLKTILITVDNGKIRLEEKKNLPESLKSLGIDLNPIQCGGNKDPWTQEREQWHSGANFLAMSPGKVVGYSRNEYTMEALNQNGYEIIKASDVIKGKIDPDSYEKAVFAIDGSELSRGGGGARCMSMPLWRSEVEMGS